MQLINREQFQLHLFSSVVTEVPKKKKKWKQKLKNQKTKTKKKGKNKINITYNSDYMKYEYRM